LKSEATKSIIWGLVVGVIMPGVVGLAGTLVGQSGCSLLS